MAVFSFILLLHYLIHSGNYLWESKEAMLETLRQTKGANFSRNIGTSTLCRALPWHLMVDRHLNLVQLGVGFMRLFGSELKRFGRHLSTYFELKKPLVEFDFVKILKKANSPFVVAVCRVTNDTRKTKLKVTFTSINIQDL